MTCLLTRALPFFFTLLIGTGLGSIFGVHKPAARAFDTHRARCARQYNRDDFAVNMLESTEAPLRILYQPGTRSTPDAIKNRTTGVVTLLVRFNADSTTTVVGRLSTLPNGLTEDAERVAEQTVFTPAMVDGKPVTETKEMNYIYSTRYLDATDR